MSLPMGVVRRLGSLQRVPRSVTRFSSGPLQSFGLGAAFGFQRSFGGFGGDYDDYYDYYYGNRTTYHVELIDYEVTLKILD